MIDLMIIGAMMAYFTAAIICLVVITVKIVRIAEHIAYISRCVEYNMAKDEEGR
jgi:hypothetical protein